MKRREGLDIKKRILDILDNNGEISLREWLDFCFGLRKKQIQKAKDENNYQARSFPEN